jgi:hypothetical protein
MRFHVAVIKPDHLAFGIFFRRIERFTQLLVALRILIGTMLLKLRAYARRMVASSVVGSMPSVSQIVAITYIPSSN